MDLGIGLLTAGLAAGSLGVSFGFSQPSTKRPAQATITVKDSSLRPAFMELLLFLFQTLSKALYRIQINGVYSNGFVTGSSSLLRSIARDDMDKVDEVDGCANPS